MRPVPHPLGVAAMALMWLLLGPAACDDEPASAGDVLATDIAGDSPTLGRDLAGPSGEDADDLDVIADAVGGDTALDAANDDSAGDTGAGADGEEDDAAGEDAALDLLDESGSPDVNPDQVLDFELEIASDGGFTGLGHRDYLYADGTLAIHYPYLEPADCSGDLSEAQITSLYAAASAVDWGSLEPSYRPTENPTCCCDQFIFALTANVTFVNADPVEAVTEWCSQSLDEGLLPTSLVALLDLLDDYGTAIIDACTGS